MQPLRIREFCHNLAGNCLVVRKDGGSRRVLLDNLDLLDDVRERCKFAVGRFGNANDGNLQVDGNFSLMVSTAYETTQCGSIGDTPVRWTYSM